MSDFSKFYNDNFHLSKYEIAKRAWSDRQSKIEQLEKEKAEITRLVQSLRNEFDLNSDCPQVDRQIELLEEALRGECE